MPAKVLCNCTARCQKYGGRYVSRSTRHNHAKSELAHLFPPPLSHAALATATEQANEPSESDSEENSRAKRRRTRSPSPAGSQTAEGEDGDEGRVQEDPDNFEDEEMLDLEQDGPSRAHATEEDEEPRFSPPPQSPSTNQSSPTPPPPSPPTRQSPLPPPRNPSPGASRSPSPAADRPSYRINVAPDFVPRTSDLDISLKFMRGIANATLENGDLDEEQLLSLRQPVQHIRELNEPDVLLSLKNFISMSGRAPESVFTDFHQNLESVYKIKTLSLPQVKKTIAELTGVFPIIHDMCPETCLAYTGPFSDLETCPTCKESRYDIIELEKSHGQNKIPRQHFYTMPLGPQLQALWATQEGARNMGHRARETERILKELEENDGIFDVYDDIYQAQEYLQAVERGDISADDVVVMVSMDGAQLYQDKQSDCWIYIWVILNLSPDIRYKRRYVLPGGIIPGPNNPKNTDSFLYPGFHHVAGLMKEGFTVWDASIDRTFTSSPFIYCGSADGPGSVCFSGLVGHHGAHPCRLYCGLTGRHKPKVPHYLPALLKPHNYRVEGCDHGDVDPATVSGCDPQKYADNVTKLLNARNTTHYNNLRKETGISSLSIFSGLPEKGRLAVPAGFPGDCMHASTLNLGDLLVPLWRGTFQCATTDNTSTWDWAKLKNSVVWEQHGKAVGGSRQYIPSSFDHPPRNIAEKINSRYKAKEWQGYLYGLAPALLYGILPLPYWQNFCKLVYAMRILHQRKLRRSQLQEAHRLILEFVVEFEELYAQRRTDQLHFIRPVLHAILHTPTETVRMGLIILYSTWTMERMVGDLGSEIRQPSNPYANLSERGLLRCQINTLKSLFTELADPPPTLPAHSEDLGNGYALLRARDEHSRGIPGEEGVVIKRYIQHMEEANGNEIPADWAGPRIMRWARLRLPNGQTARSAWKENQHDPKNVRRSRFVKLSIDGQIEFAEVRFFFNARINEVRTPLALVSVLSRPDDDLFKKSYSTIWSVTHPEDAGLRVVHTSSILSVVAVIPHDHHLAEDNSDRRFFVWEYMGLEMALLSGALVEEEDGIDNVNI